MLKLTSVGSSLLPTLAGVCLAIPAYAQAPAAPTDTREVGQVEEIVVTARRREERLQDVPISITVFNQQQLTDRNIVNAGDLATYTPSLTSNSRFGAESTSFAIRGFIQEGPTSPSVAVYFADVVALRANGGTTAGNGAGPGSYFDLQNVQVLKGPQGTLFGRNTTGGAVLLVPQKPEGEFGAYVEASAGNYNLQRVQAVLNAPFGDNFRVRLGVDWNTRDGYLRNVAFVPNTPLVGPKDFGDVDYTAVRLSAVWDIAPNLENYTIGSYSDSDTNGFMPRMVFAFPTGYRAANYNAQVAALSGDYYDVSNGNPDARQRIEQWQVINTTTWTATDTLTLKNIISYGEFQQAQAADIYGDNGVTAGNPLHYNYAVNITPRSGEHNVSQSTFTEELQVQGQLGDRFNYQAGAYYEYAEPLDGFQETYSGIFLDCVDLLSLTCTDTRGRLTPGPGGVPLEGFIGQASISRSQYTFRNRGVYAQGTYEFTDQFSLTAGIRYTSDDTSGLGQPLRARFPAANTPTFSCANPPPLTQGGTSAEILADPSRCNISRSESSDKPTWLIDFDYKPTDQVLLYAKYARGYRQGSVNVSSYGLETWGPEQVDTYEIGAKTAFDAAVSGIFNIAVFYNDFTDQQLQLGTVACTTISQPQCPFVPSPAAGIANAGKSTIQGVEVEAAINLFQGFRVELGYTYLDSKIESITLPPPPLGFTALTTAAAGGPIPLTPENKYAVTLSYTLPLAESIGAITFAATGTYQDETLGSVSSQSSGLYTLPEQKLLNLNLNWASIAGLPLDLNIFATNVTEEEFHVFTTGASFGFDSLIVNEPLMYGARLKYRFGK
jgi:iron complex outermembrane receptor protein